MGKKIKRLYQYIISHCHH